eukprot:TRINITY_DN12754_c0_g1_i1.p1 TRINITY_DN12754_c0_g1~~TRINITY_DN12754_c0_g1_i1.p1  ORF type:complete len:287 (-),score=91.94 TRINITY_DN12754_c0_g1_i1:39-899(-)
MEEDNKVDTEILDEKAPSCQFYPNKVPEKDELVTVRVNSIDDMGVLCSLLEYDDLEGFLPLSEISRKRMRSVLRHVRVGQKQVLQVIRVDTERGYTDLSKKYIAEVEREKGNEKFIKGKTVHGIAKRLAETQHLELNDVMTKWVWPLYDTYQHPYDAFKLLAGNEADIYADMDIPTDIKEALRKIVAHQLAVQPVKIGAHIDVTSFTGGISVIKQALQAGIAAGVQDDVSIQLVRSPTFMIWTTTVDEAKGIAALENVISVIQEEITKQGGSFAVKKEPGVITKVE